MEEEGKGLGPGRQGEHWLGPRPGLGQGLRGVQSWGYRKRGEAEVGTELKRGGGSKSWGMSRSRIRPGEGMEQLLGSWK